MTNHRMHGSGGGERILKFNVNSRRPVMRVVRCTMETAATLTAIALTRRYAYY